MIRVVLVDDQALIRMGFRMVLSAHDDLEIVGEAADGAAAVRVVAETAPDVVLMDVRMPGVDGVTATRRIREAGIESRILVLTTFDVDEHAFAALRAGASGFLLKDVPPDELIGAIRSVASGDAVVSPRITRHLLDTYAAELGTADPAETDRALDTLTVREREVLHQVALGRSNAEIAAALFVAEATVKTHVTRILTKLGLRDRVQVVVYAYQNRLVQP